MGRPPGAYDVQLRLKDLDEEGVWGEIVYPSIGLWNGLIKDPVLYRDGVRVAQRLPQGDLPGRHPPLHPGGGDLRALGGRRRGRSHPGGRDGLQGHQPAHHPRR